MTVPLLILALLLLGSAASFLIARYRPTLAPSVALGSGILALLLWLAVWFQLPSAAGAGAPALIVDSEAWQVSLLLLILLISALLIGVGRTGASEGVAAGATLLLACAGIASLCAGSLMILLPAWILLGVVWTLALSMALKTSLWELLGILAIAWIGVFFIGMGAANLSQVGPGSLQTGAPWSDAALFWTTLGALWQLLVIPFLASRRSGDDLAGAGLTTLLYATPAATGGFLLFRLVEISAQAIPLLLIVLALVLFLWALNRVWVNMQLPGAQARSLWLALAVLVVPAAADGAAVLPMLRLLLLAGGVFLLTPLLKAHGSLANTRLERITFLFGPTIALAAMAALPLTAGFAAFSALYDAWIGDGYWPLVPLTSLLLMPLIAAGLSYVWSSRAASEEFVSPGNGTRLLPASRLALILPALFLLTPGGLTTTSLWSWLAVSLSIGGGVAIFRFLPRAREVHAAALTALTRRSFPAWPGDLLKRGVSQGALLLQQAAAILEGEWGLLWLLMLIALLLLLR